MIYFESVVNSVLINVLDDSSNFTPDDTSEYIHKLEDELFLDTFVPSHRSQPLRMDNNDYKIY